MASLLVWEGPSAFDGAPIQVVLTGLDKESSNRKTGAMVQAWILPVEERPNKQASVCGDCPVKAACYVTWFQAPNAVWRSRSKVRVTPDEAAEHIRGRVLRIGAAGDPAMVPVAVWETLTRHVKGWTGYTHQWRTCDPSLARFCMASVESTPDRVLAKQKGYRTFRIRASAANPVGEREVVCPASNEAGYRTSCERCGLCQGASRQAKDIVIIAHGVSAKRLLPVLHD